MKVKLLRVTACSECRHCDRPTPIYSASCCMARNDAGFWGKTIENYPYLPDWCPLPDAEGDE